MVGVRDFSIEIAGIVERVRDSVITVVVEAIDPLSMLEAPVRGVGSGFIVGEDLALTNSHVVGSAIEARVIYSDGEVGVGRVLARDPYRDLALLEVESRGRRVRMGDSDKVRIGELVIALGSPLGMPGPSVTLGVVSARGRTIVADEGRIVLEDLIQTDAAINPGNSGGPLINMDAEAIGVTTAMIPFAQGIGFGIPINHAKRFITLISKYGRPVRAWIGVFVAPLTPEIARMMGLEKAKGVVVIRTIPGSPAEAVGIRRGDVILKVGGKEISTPGDLRNTIEDNIDRGEIEIELIRRGYVRVVSVPIVVEEL
ncbi:serine protease [Desulfurococcaceae archaeon AG1]|nr:serine protease [Desulfurococcaceae archaeon AG1]